jgi:uncharacterized membrane protein YdjX (TVP38/TMEM64 family)
MLEAIIAEFESLHPAYFIAGLILLPLGPVPVTGLWLLAGMRFGGSLGLVICLLCLIINSSIAYLIASKLLRSQIEWLLRNRKIKVPTLPASDRASFSFMVRIIPGLPLFIQNYLLGFIRLPLRYYFGIGLPIQTMYAIGFVVFGGAIFQGKIGTMIFACLFIAAFLIAVKLFLKHFLARRKHLLAATEKTLFSMPYSKK